MVIMDHSRVSRKDRETDIHTERNGERGGIAGSEWLMAQLNPSIFFIYLSIFVCGAVAPLSGEILNCCHQGYFKHV